ncbi:MAG: hypothetical protein WDO14_01500 [Bacteroidota bacterium]
MKYSMFILAVVLVSCIPDSAKQQINQQVTELQKMMADQQFTKGIAFIELHKVRYGSYPESFKDLKFLSAMDSTMSSQLDYKRLENGYELNIKGVFMNISGDPSPVTLKYPAEFWEGLGCIKSNTKE